MVERKKSGAGGKLSRSEVVTVRLDPRLRYGVELAARKHRRTASSFIEWAIEHALKQVVIREDGTGDLPWEMMVDDVLTQVWDVDESDRFVKLALNYPELLSHEEQVLWKLIRECGLIWRGKYVRRADSSLELTWKVGHTTINHKSLREHWDTFKQVARGELPHDALPTWRKEKPLIDFDENIDGDIKF